MESRNRLTELKGGRGRVDRCAIARDWGEGGDCVKHYAMWNMLYVSEDKDY